MDNSVFNYEIEEYPQILDLHPQILDFRSRFGPKMAKLVTVPEIPEKTDPHFANAISSLMSIFGGKIFRPFAPNDNQFRFSPV